MGMHPMVFPGMLDSSGTVASPSFSNVEVPSMWLVAPYFLIYFLMYILNTLIWPLQLMERACTDLLPKDERMKFVLINQPKRNMDVYGPAYDASQYDQPTNSCIGHYISGGNQTSQTHVNTTTEITINVMILASFAGGMLSIVAYFLIWKPLLTKCRGFALFLPPICMICQSLLLAYAQEISDFTAYKYTVLSSVILSSLHCSFQGVFLLLFQMSEVPEVKSKREIANTRLDGSHVVIFSAILFGGCFITVCFDMTYNYVFFIQFALGCVDLMYALTLLPASCPCMSGVEEDEEKEKKEEEVKKVETKLDSFSDCSDNSSEEEILLSQMVRNRTDDGLLTKHTNLFKEVPMIFSETSYKKEMIVIIEICVFTLAMVADTGISGVYLVQSPLSFDLKSIGYCVAAQGLIRIVGMLVVKFATHFSQLKHGSLICFAAMNYIGYYIALSLVSTKVAIVVVMFSNVVGGLAFPTLFSFIKHNLRETTDVVIEISVISSLLVTTVFTAMEFFIYEKTKNVFPGAIFMLTASIIAISIIIILATMLSSAMKNKRKSKYFADKLLNNNH